MSATTAVPELSIVIPALNEAENVQPLIEEIETVVMGAGLAAEVILVDDGSSDGTAERALESVQ